MIECVCVCVSIDIALTNASETNRMAKQIEQQQQQQQMKRYTFGAKQPNENTTVVTNDDSFRTLLSLILICYNCKLFRRTKNDRFV